MECESSEKQSFSSREVSRMHLKSDPSAPLCNFLNINLLGADWRRRIDSIRVRQRAEEVGRELSVWHNTGTLQLSCFHRAAVGREVDMTRYSHTNTHLCTHACTKSAQVHKWTDLCMYIYDCCD